MRYARAASSLGTRSPRRRAATAGHSGSEPRRDRREPHDDRADRRPAAPCAAACRRRARRDRTRPTADSRCRAARARPSTIAGTTNRRLNGTDGERRRSRRAATLGRPVRSLDRHRRRRRRHPRDGYSVMLDRYEDRRGLRWSWPCAVACARPTPHDSRRSPTAELRDRPLRRRRARQQRGRSRWAAPRSRERASARRARSSTPSAPAVRPTTDTDCVELGLSLRLPDRLAVDATTQQRHHDSATTAAPSVAHRRRRAARPRLGRARSPRAARTTASTSIGADARRRRRCAVQGSRSRTGSRRSITRDRRRVADRASFDARAELRRAARTLFSITGAGARGRRARGSRDAQSFRIGASLVERRSTAARSRDRQCTDPTICDGYILPDRVVTPCACSPAARYRWAATAWNQTGRRHVSRRARRSPLVADVVVTGAVAERVRPRRRSASTSSQRIGRHVASRVRGGVEYEWLPGRLRVRAGSYWEPGPLRRRRAAASTRRSASRSASFEFQLWGRRRGRITLTGDVAARYRNVGLSIGFWH